MGKMQRTKGANAERDVVNILKKSGFPDAQRNLDQYQATDGRDIKNTSHLCIQVKCGKRPPIMKGYEEAKSAAKGVEIPVCVHRKDRGEWMATLGFQDFLEAAAEVFNIEFTYDSGR